MKALIVIIALSLASCTYEVNALTVGWDANPPPDNVAIYEITVAEVFGMQSAVYLTTQTRLTVTGLQAGRPYLITARAKSVSGLWSEPSESLSVTPQVRRVFEHSEDLVNWIVIKVDTGPSTKGFMRCRIEPP